MKALLDRVILDVGPCLSWLQILLSSPLPARFLLRNQLIVLWALLCRYLSPFKILSFCLILGNVIMMCLGVCFLGSNFFGTLWASWTSWKSISLARLGTFSFIICSNKFSIYCSSSSPSGSPMIRMLECFKMSWRFLNLFSFFWILVSSFFSGWMFLSSFWSTPLIWVPVSFHHYWFPVHFPLFHLA